MIFPGNLLFFFAFLLAQWCSAQKEWVLTAGPQYSWFHSKCEECNGEQVAVGKLGAGFSVSYSDSPADSTKQSRIQFGFGYTQRAFSVRLEESSHYSHSSLDADVRYGAVDAGFLMCPSTQIDGSQYFFFGFRLALPIWALMKGISVDQSGSDTTGWKNGIDYFAGADLRLTLGLRNRIAAKAGSAWWIDFGIDHGMFGIFTGGINVNAVVNSTDIFLRCTRTLPW